ncbi:MAG: DUF5060 domain-containing protein [Candidatus Marinimicrobia bacterium]|nr:DUF5060 domain-containing protein [Candidatus Neomarinimicrobiota bacterium]MCF7828302.1 DUF5060 domain-containing protein [Candidatus Neomarinimicrobiota bacterium]MCF7879523.1 DUF5060 domain-containing protein [Candidatus Neomarinimicrobiota bacterium]
MSGELRKWHKVTLTFEGPETSEQATPNPFLDYRLNVRFINGDTTFLVPGYFAADGDAANTSASSGDKWRVHFAPHEAGIWNYEVSFRSGRNIAVSDNPDAGKSAGFMDGKSGTFRVKETDKSGRDFRGKGRLQYVGKHYLRFEETGEYFLKAGADAPENFLAYKDFDGDFKHDGHNDDLIKSWEPHVQDWNQGDPVWQDGKGKGILGAINYLASKGINVFSFLTMNIGGDDRNVFPYVTYDDYTRLDVSRLAQWEILFQHADSLGMYLHFKTQEAENQDTLDAGALGVERKLYYRELIARFGHHLALNWNLGEENGKWGDHEGQSTPQRRAMAGYFREYDPYRHHIVIHNGQSFDDLLGDKSKLTGVSVQTHRSDFRQVHDAILHWRQASDQSGKPWVVAIDEPGNASDALLPDAENQDHDNARQNALWGALMAGAGGIEYYFGYDHPQSDLTCQDWRSRSNMWDQSRYALNFFREHEIPFWEMTNTDDLTTDTTDYCFSKEGEVYVIYMKTAEENLIDLGESVGRYQVEWFNPRTGGALKQGSIGTIAGPGEKAIGAPPADPEKDWVALIRAARLGGW